MKYNLYFKSAVLFLFLLTFFGCLAFPPNTLHFYEGPPLPKEQVGVLSHYWKVLRIEEVDGKTFAEILRMNKKKAVTISPPFFGKSAYTQTIAMLPGEHIVKLGGYPGNNKEVRINPRLIDGGITKIRDERGDSAAFFGEWTLKISVEPGQKYTLGYDEKELGKITPYIMNRANKQKVSSVINFKKRYISTWQRK